MNGYKGPVDIPLIGDLITQVVEQFAAEDESINCDIWYHDEPVWLVWKEEEKGTLFQQVQIAAFLTKEGEQLYFIPQAYSFEEGMRKKTPWDPDWDSKKNIMFPLRDFYIFSKTAPPTLDLEAIRNKVMGHLVDAWAIAVSYRKDALIKY